MLSATYITSLLLACATLTLAAPLVEPVVALQARATGDGRPPGFTFLGYDPSTPMSVVGTGAYASFSAIFIKADFAPQSRLVSLLLV
jgi:hypothetical protein